ncbi:hypothetical protein Tco_1170046 [Tanacetum coccineum]
MGWVMCSDAVLESHDTILIIVVTVSRCICDAVSSHCREILEQCWQEFEDLLLEHDILSFIRDLGHFRDIIYLSDVSFDYLHQPWRAFATIINKCLSGKETGMDKIRLSHAQILGVRFLRSTSTMLSTWEDSLSVHIEIKDAKISLFRETRCFAHCSEMTLSLLLGDEFSRHEDLKWHYLKLRPKEQDTVPQRSHSEHGSGHGELTLIQRFSMSQHPRRLVHDEELNNENILEVLSDKADADNDANSHRSMHDYNRSRSLNDGRSKQDSYTAISMKKKKKSKINEEENGSRKGYELQGRGTCTKFYYDSNSLLKQAPKSSEPSPADNDRFFVRTPHLIVNSHSLNHIKFHYNLFLHHLHSQSSIVRQATPTPTPTASETTTSTPARSRSSTYTRTDDEKNAYIELIDTSMRATIKEEVNTQLPQILPQAISNVTTPVIEKNVTMSLEAAVLTIFHLNHILYEQLQHSLSMQQDQEFITGDNDEQPADKEVTKADWFKKPELPPTPDID